MANTIALKGDYVRKEAEASEAITPGHLVEFGGANDLQKHSTAAGQARKAFALENDLIGDGIDDAYASGDTVQYGVFPPGSEVNAILAANQTAAKGAKLVSNGDGTLAVMGSDEEDGLVAWAMETVTTSGSTDRIVVEVA